MSGFPILVRAVLERVPKVVLSTPFARALHRKGGARTVVVNQGAAGTLPIPILSLEGSKSGCSPELQALISAFRDAPRGTPQREAARDDLLAYIEDALGQTIAQAYPGQFEAARSGTDQTITIDLGDDEVTLTLTQCDDPTGELSDCQQQLQNLVDAVQASPGNVTAMNNLIRFIEDQKGEVIDELSGSAWDQVQQDGVARTVVIDVCDSQVTLRIDGTLRSTTGCRLDRYTLHLTQNDFTLDHTQQFTPPSSSFWSGYITPPSSTVHLENPRLEWLGIGVDDAILSRAKNLGTTSVLKDGVQWRPAYRINGSYTTTIAVQQVHDASRTPADRFNYEIKLPPFGFKLITRRPSGSPTGLTVDNPLRLGSISSGQISPANTDYCRAVDRTHEGEFNEWQLPPIAASQPFVPNIEIGASSMAQLQTRVSQYNSQRTIVDPVLTLDEANMTATVTFLTRDNAKYVGATGCGSSNTAATKVFDAITVDWGGYYSGGGTPQLRTNSIFTAFQDDWIEGVLERVIRNSDNKCGVAHTNYDRQLPAAAGTFDPKVGALIDLEHGGHTACPGDARCITPGPP